MSNPYGGLKERVANAKGADREIDGAIVLAMGGPPDTAFPFQADVAWTYRGAGEWVTPSPRSLGIDVVWKCPPYTASLDAALALVEAKLPGWGWAMSHSTGYRPDATLYGPTTKDSGHAKGDTPALALLSALLEALDTGDEHGR